MIKPILGSGLIAVDHIFLATDAGRSPNYEYLGSSGGGSVSNILCMLSLLELESNIFGLTGNDIGEKIVKEDFKSFNINYDNVITRGDRNDIRSTRQFAHRILLNGRHYFSNLCLECGEKFTSNYQFSIKDLSKKVRQLVKKSNVIIDRANLLNLELSKISKKNNNLVTFDFGFTIYGSYEKNANQILQYSDIVKINEKVFNKFLGGSKERIIDRWCERYPNTKYLFITRGEKGVHGFATIENERKYFDYSSIPCDRIKDTSGAGDIFTAIITSNLFEEYPPSIQDFKQSVEVAQALASLSCTLYGARALQRFYSKQRSTSEDIYESAEQILLKKRVENPFSPVIGLPDSISKPYRFSKIKNCKICGKLSAIRNNKASKRKRRKKTLTLHKSLIQAPWTMISSYNIGKSNRDVIKNDINKNSIFVGSGGSFSTCNFAETLFFNELQQICKVITPFELEGLKNINVDFPVWFFSHGGNNSDILGAAFYGKKKLGLKKGIIITGNKNSKLAQLSNEYGWKTIIIPSKERNFVSVVGYLSQVSVLCGLIASDKENELNDFFSESNLRNLFNIVERKMQQLALKIANSTREMQKIHIVGLARGWGWPALIDLESKIVEGGICTIEISELKNYTHGRYINTFGDRKNRRVIILKTPPDAEFVPFLEKKFGKYVDHYVIETEKEGLVGSLELVIQTLFFSWFIGQIAHRNILSPSFPREARGLYSWAPNWRKDMWREK